ncbi:MAG: hypothetical protein GWN73_02795, partial [Actinobacteria bacterium]|nr:hypothetical protein [Actinomycetota bacterium]NIW26220.1 hypothetical protein [Actinomycetota bacterium]
MKGVAIQGGELWALRLVSGGGNVIEGSLFGDRQVGSSDAVLLVESSDNTIGGTSPAARNVVSGGGDGIRIQS